MEKGYQIGMQTDFEEFKNQQMLREKILSSIVFALVDIIRDHLTDDEWYAARDKLRDLLDAYKEQNETSFKKWEGCSLLDDKGKQEVRAYLKGLTDEELLKKVDTYSEMPTCLQLIKEEIEIRKVKNEKW